jgi:hypothetical protein
MKFLDLVTHIAEVDDVHVPRNVNVANLGILARNTSCRVSLRSITLHQYNNA